MLTASNQFENELKKRINEEIERLKDILAQGQAVTDYADYKFLAGQLHSLRRVAESYCDEVATAINKR